MKENHVEELEEEIEEKVEIDYSQDSIVYYKKIKRKVIGSLISFVIIIITAFFKQYEDFDVAFTSTLFIALLIAAIIITGIGLMRIIKSHKSLELERTRNELKRFNDIYDVFSVIPLFIAIVSFSNAFFISPATVVKTSMEPNYYEGDNILVYHFFEQYERFDVAIIKVVEDDYYIKRVIGLPGETVVIKNGEIYIDGELLNDPTILKDGAKTYCNVGFNVDPNEECSFSLEEGQYFMLGDNREGSLDSRSFGVVLEEEIFGKVVLKIDILN